VNASFGHRLRAALASRGPLCVGIDPHPGLLARWGLDDDPAGLERFALGAVEALGGQVAVLKPQAAFFERHGSAGVAVLERVLAAAAAAGALTILDAKRGDIGSTMEAYARAYSAPGAPLAADALTASPYLGVGSLTPLLEAARASGRGVFVLALTSNPGGAQVQLARRPDGRSVAQSVVDEVAEWNGGQNAQTSSDATGAAGPPGPFGVVVGLTTAGTGGLDLHRLGGPVLVPGLGAQGGDPADLQAAFGGLAEVGVDLLPSSSREVLQAGPDPARLREAAQRALDAVRAGLGPS
jgi:orotidine-5'-phosphate decarboxylase